MADMAFDDPSMSLGSVRAELLREELGEHGNVDWITLAVAAGIALTFTASSLSAIYGVLPIWLAALVNLAAIYCSQIITHEAVQATILRRGRTFGWLNILL